jgi:predicted dehydrogenase
MAYLPAFKKADFVQLTCLVDTDVNRAQVLAKDFDLSYVGKDLEAIFDYVDAVIVAVPNYLHFPVCKTFLKAGKHVLCEKPMATKSHECKNLVSSANTHSVKLAVAHVRRFYPAVKKIREIILSRDLGNVESFDFEEGTVYSWPTVSGFFFDKEKAGGGVLIDIGSHLLDILLWWLPYEIQHIDYKDDNLGGVEAFAEIKIDFTNGVGGRIRVSRLSILENFYTIYFEKGFVKWDPLAPRRIFIRRLHDTPMTIKVEEKNPIKDMLHNFIYSIQNNQQVLVSGEDGLKVIDVIERCYNSRKIFPLEWLRGKDGV